VPDVSRAGADRGQGGVAHFTDLLLCGSIWACPECSAKIRAVRSDEIARAVDAHMKAGGTAWMVTSTARHRSCQSLAPTLDAVAQGFKRLMSGRAAVAEKADLGVARAIDRRRRDWAQSLADRGFEPSRERGVRWEPVTRAQETGRYLAKVRDGDDLGMKMGPAVT